MFISNQWHNAFAALHALCLSQKNLGKAPRYDLIGRAISSLLNDPIGIADFSPWRVIGITPSALDVIAANNFKTAGLPHKDRIVRGHIAKRVKVTEHLFGQPLYVSKPYFETTFENHDVTVLMCKNENHAKAIGVPDFYPIANNYYPFVNHLPVLFATKFISYTYDQAEAATLQQIYNDAQTGQIQVVNQLSLPFINPNLI